MIFTQDVGIVASTGDVRQFEKVLMAYVTGGAIPVGKAAMISVADTTGATVVVATTTDDHIVQGIYEGDSEGRGAATTTSGLSGKDAVSGEGIYIAVFGPSVVLAHDSTTDASGTIAATDALGFSAQGGIANKAADPSAGLISPIFALEAQTSTSTAGVATKCYVRFM